MTMSHDSNSILACRYTGRLCLVLLAISRLFKLNFFEHSNLSIVDRE
jgi:hypothetical protein